MYKNYMKNKNFELFNNLRNADVQSWEMRCNLLFNFFDENLIIKSLITELKQKDSYKNDWNYKLLGSITGNVDLKLPDNEIEMAALSLKLIEDYSKNFGALNRLSYHLGDKNRQNKFHNIFSDSLKGYIDNQLEWGNLILYLLNKYKCQCEWFNYDELIELYESNTQHGEELLTKDLRKFLFNNGIDYPFSEPNTPSGKPDLIYGIDTKNPLTLEVKLFGGRNNYGKDYIKKGFNQVISYANNYNESFGYLLIFNLSEKLLQFDLNNDEDQMMININNKTIFLIVVNLSSYSESASKSKKDFVIIDEDYLVK